MPSQPKKDSGNTIPRARGYGANLTDREQGEHKAHKCRISPPGIEVKAPRPDGIPNKVLKIAIKATLDVKNAFNSASWHHTLNALSNNLGC